MLRYLTFIGQVALIFGTKIGCDSFNVSQIDCESWLYFFSERNLEQTLYCLGYNKHVYPSNPTKVWMERKLLQFISINENQRYVEFEEVYSFKLRDPGLNLNFCKDKKIKLIFTGAKLVNLFWMPNFDTHESSLFKPKFTQSYVYFNDEKRTYNIKTMNVMYRIRIQCDMDFKWYPFDTQVCSHAMLIDEDLKDVVITYDHNDTIEKSTFDSPDWDISLVVDNISTKDGQQLFPLDLVFQRKIIVHILHLYVPSIMLCIASVASLFIPQVYVPGRMGLSVTSCLSMITLFVLAKYFSTHTVFENHS